MHDCIIIGAGPAGLSVAMWCENLGLDAVVVEKEAEIGGQLLRTFNPITNYLGVAAANGNELRDIFAAQLKDHEFDLWTRCGVTDADLRARKVTLNNGEQLQAIFIVIATGVRRRKLGVPGEIELKGHGVIESGTRDRELITGREICIIGGGDAAAENALLLSEVCSTVTIVHRGKRLRARSEFVERIARQHRITVLTESTVNRIIGKECVKGVEIYHQGTIEPFAISARAVLIRIGVEPNSELFSNHLELDERGFIKTSVQHETSIQNVFAVGDISNPAAPTISGAVGTGATVAKIISERLGRA
ncbi:MAG: NAD(P)/FAD-dependent oxidoreductase [Pyrinomonadaceae bacterium]